MSTHFELPAELTVYSAGETARALVACLAVHDPADAALAVGADQVLEVDGAGLQLLVALQKSCATRGWALHLQQPTESLRKACSILGLQDLLTPTMNGACP